MWVFRITASSHGFPNTDEVFHPDSDGFCIGQSRERFPAQGVALFEPDPSVLFKNEP